MKGHGYTDARSGAVSGEFSSIPPPQPDLTKNSSFWFGAGASQSIARERRPQEQPQTIGADATAAATGTHIGGTTTTAFSAAVDGSHAITAGVSAPVLAPAPEASSAPMAGIVEQAPVDAAAAAAQSVKFQVGRYKFVFCFFCTLFGRVYQLCIL